MLFKSMDNNFTTNTLISMGVPTKLAQTAVRISLDDDNDMGQVEQFLTIFKQVKILGAKSSPLPEKIVISSYLANSSKIIFFILAILGRENSSIVLFN